MSLENLREKRRKWVEANKENGFEDGIKRLLTDLYPDNAHFIYELLQNAEDTRASVVRFTLSDSAVEFEHNGERLFALKDVESITSIGVSTKRDDSTSIGKFGVGFKAVFAYTNSPEIHSGDFHFRIHDLVVPETEGVSHTKMGERETHFVFPFDNPKKPCKRAVEEIERGLRALGDNTLLFLSHIRKIEYCLPAGDFSTLERIENENGRIEIRTKTSATQWMRFQKDVDIEDESGATKTCRVAIAYQFNFDKKIHPLQAGQVSIYFPAEKETSNLRFHLHAPFASTVARDSVRDCEDNRKLRDHLAGLVVESLATIRDLDMLTVGFLAVLPNPQDSLSAFYEPIRIAVVQAFKDDALTPTRSGSHAPAEGLFRGPARIQEVLDDSDLSLLTQREAPLWSKNPPQENQREARFLAALGIAEWSFDNLFQKLIEKASEKTRRISLPPYSVTGVDEEFMAWYSSKPVEWHQGFYALLADHLKISGWREERLASQLKPLRIVRLSDGSHGIGNKSFFPSEGIVRDDLMPRVDAGIYTSGKNKNQQESAKRFLETIGVREVGEAEQVEAILKQRYTNTNFKPKVEDLKRFVALVEKEPDKAKLFEQYFIFERDDGKWGKPSGIFLDHPFKDTGLSIYYNLFGEGANRAPLSKSYLDNGVPIKKMVAFAEAVGVKTRLEITETDCYGNPEWKNLCSVRGERSTSPINRDYVIAGLDKLLAQPSMAASNLIWRTMCTLPRGRYLTATYQKSEKWGAHYAVSKLIHDLRGMPWVPQGDGIFVRPGEATREQLPGGFAFDPDWEWIKAISFGVDAAVKTAAYHHKQTVAQALGFDSPEEAEKWKKVKDAGISPDEILAQHAQRGMLSQPEESVRDPVRRRRNVLANIEDAPSKESVQRERSVQQGISTIAAEAKAYLRTKYKNHDGQLVCQCCKDEMPFKLPRSEEYYFEAVQCIGEKETRHFQNRLALCPTCAAMYQYAREPDDTELLRRIVEHSGDDQADSVEIPVRLAGRERTLRFVGTHWFDLKTVLKGT